MTTHPCPKTMNLSAGKPTSIGLLYSNVSTPPLTTGSPQLTCRLTPPFSQPLIRVIFLPRRVSICTLFSFTASMIPSASTLSSIIMMIGVLHLYLPTFDVTTSIHRLALLEPATSSVTLLAPPSRSPAPCLSIATSPPSLITPPRTMQWSPRTANYTAIPSSFTSRITSIVFAIWTHSPITLTSSHLPPQSTQKTNCGTTVIWPTELTLMTSYTKVTTSGPIFATATNAAGILSLTTVGIPSSQIPIPFTPLILTLHVHSK